MEVLFKLFQDGQLPQLAQWLLLLNILDVVSGIIKGIDTKSLSSKLMKHGALTKIVIWTVVLVSGVVSSYFNTDLTSYVIGYYLVMEGVSVLENTSQFISVPEKLKDILNVNNVNNVEKQEKNAQTKEDLVVNDSSVNDDILNFIKEKENEWCNF